MINRCPHNFKIIRLVKLSQEVLLKMFQEENKFCMHNDLYSIIKLYI
jgi:heterodisulfide reductase subunit C